ncbi:hypothetical protein [Pantoea sp. 18069]|uniref:hypothetical protein n=1 Tax=Pantoea sp. 18069 TaxID=2681415 RepID=UPI0013595FF7|nr:hypothetical protein [Pantoea sp. 18069]
MSGERDSAWRAGNCHSAYWPQHELDAFILQMAGHGRAVHAAMMLGDFDYARQQLAAAQSIGCPQLHRLSARLCAYFDQPACASTVDTH